MLLLKISVSETNPVGHNYPRSEWWYVAQLRELRESPIANRSECAMTSSRATAVDKLVGRNLRVYRLRKSLSQTDLANQLGVSFQQVQKYENGSNRVSSGRLLQIATIMEVPVTAFFEGSDDARRLDHKSVYDQLSHP